MKNKNTKHTKKYSFSFSWKRALGISSAKQKFTRKTGIPTTRAGCERKIGGFITKFIMKIFGESKK